MKRPDLMLCVDFATLTGIAWLSRNSDNSYSAELETWKLDEKGKKGVLNDAQKGLKFKALVRTAILRRKPNMIVYEAPFVHAVNKSGIGLNFGLKMLLETEAEYLGVAYIGGAVSSIKKVVAGHGKAKKDQVREVVQELYGVKAKNNDESDALAAGTWALKSIEWDDDDEGDDPKAA